jgi:uncharacterized protein YbaP (TraB family)
MAKGPHICAPLFNKMRSLCTALLAFCLLSFPTFSQIKCNSLFWEITGKNLKKPAYLYGTMHVSNKVAFKLPDSFFVALKSVDRFALETDPEKWLDSYYKKGENPVKISKENSSGGSNFYKYAFYINKLDNNDIQNLIKYDPRIVNGLFHRKHQGSENFEENSFLDMFIFQAGKKYGKAFASLENLDEASELVNRAELALKDADDEDKMSSSQRRKFLNGMDYEEFIQDAYRKGDLDLLDSTNRLFRPSAGYHKYMLEVRNRMMVRVMDSLLQTQSVFAGVGAAHLPGNTGMLQMLQKLGYKVRPVFNSMDIESKYKAEVEKTNFPVVLKPFVEKDSLFSVQVPGKMVDISTIKSYKYYLYPDMANGCFYMVLSAQNFGGLLGISPNSYQSKVDSLLFENIPGKILKKEPFVSSNGWKGIHIENVTARGDHQVHRFMFTPHQFILVKVHGFQEYVKGPEVQAFLSSLTFFDKHADLVEKSWPEMGVKVKLPGQIFLQNTAHFQERPYCHVLASGLDNEGKQFVFLRTPFHDYRNLEEDTFELGLMADQFCIANGFKMKHKKHVSKSLLPELVFTAEYGKAIFFGKVVLGHPFYYLMLTNSNKKSETYFKSLVLSKPVYTEPFQTYIDSSLFFSVQVPEVRSKRLEDVQAYQPKILKNKTRKGDDSPDHEEYYLNRSHYFTALGSQEAVAVDFVRFSRYSAVEVEDSFWVSRSRRYGGYGDLALKKQTRWERNGLKYAEFLYGDTNTLGVLRVRLILKGEALYVLKTHSDPERLGGAFADRFFETFQPTDTLMGTDLWTSKADLFFKDLFGKDEVKKETARFAYFDNDVEFLPKDHPKILQKLRSRDFFAETQKMKRNLIFELSESKDDKVADELQKLFQELTDSTELQYHILRTLASIQSTKSTQHFLNLVLSDTPPLEDADEGKELFEPFFDSVQLGKQLFPRILELTRYPEYKGPIHNLLAWLAYQGGIPPDAYRPYLSVLSREMKDEIQRQYSRDKDPRERSRYGNSVELDKPDTRKDPMESDVFSDPSDDASDTYFGNLTLYTLSISILPFLDEAPTRALWNKLYRIKDQKTLASIFSYALSRKVPIPDSLMGKIYSHPEAMLHWYKCLQKYDLLQHFDKKYLKRTEFAKTVLLAYENLDPVKDTVEFVKKIACRNKYQDGYLYFFRQKAEQNNTYNLHITGFVPKDEKQWVPYNTVRNMEREYSDSDDLKKSIEEMVMEVRCQYRRRASNNRYRF